MSEIAKCPICGDDPDVLVDLFDKHGKFPKGYACCGVDCRTLELWNQYAAAMELAKTIVESENCKAEDEYKYQEFIEWARQYVLEVFK